jgi:signal transduction histidine kinase
MHDGLGGQLVSLLSMVERGVAVPHEIAESLRRALDDIRIVIDSLDPNATDLPASLGKLRSRLEPLLQRNGITLTWNIDNDIRAEEFPPEAVLHVLRIIQEAVTNTLRHANACRIDVRMSFGDEERDHLQLSIHDDGRGLSTHGTTTDRGLRNMNSRAEKLGAELQIERTGSGTHIDLSIPLPR